MIILLSTLLRSWYNVHSKANLPMATDLTIAALQTLERSYLLRMNGKVVERPQHMLMRVSLGIHKEVTCRTSLLTCNSGVN